MCDAALRGFWMTSRAPYGYRKVIVQDGAKKRPVLERDPAIWLARTARSLRIPEW